MKKIKLLLFSIFFLLAGCQNTDSQISQNSNEIKDRAGNPVVLPENIEKIISMSPSATEILIDLGVGDKIIAVDSYSNTERFKKEVLLFDLMNPDVEQLINLRPDIVFATSMSMSGGIDPYKPLKDVGICLCYIPSSNSIDAIKEDIKFFSEVVKELDKGNEIIKSMEDEINKINKIGQTINNKKTVYFEIGQTPALYSFGSNVFLNEMIEIIGAENILKNEDAWIEVSEEVVINSNPDVILTNVNYIEEPVDEIKNREAFKVLDAVKNNEVYYIDNVSSSLPSHKIITALNEMAKAVYPEYYS